VSSPEVGHVLVQCCLCEGRFVRGAERDAAFSCTLARPDTCANTADRADANVLVGGNRSSLCDGRSCRQKPGREGDFRQRSFGSFSPAVDETYRAGQVPQYVQLMRPQAYPRSLIRSGAVANIERLDRIPGRLWAATAQIDGPGADFKALGRPGRGLPAVPVLGKGLLVAVRWCQPDPFPPDMNLYDRAGPRPGFQVRIRMVCPGFRGVEILELRLLSR
jgi:hypothetical protein